jgi:hypothetical protein
LCPRPRPDRGPRAVLRQGQNLAGVGLHQCPSERKGEGGPVRSRHALLTSPATRRMPPKCGAFPVQPRRSPLRQTACWRKGDSNRWSHVPTESPFQILFCRPELHRLKADPFRPEGSGRRVEFHFPPPRLCCDPGREPASILGSAADVWRCSASYVAKALAAVPPAKSLSVPPMEVTNN